MAAQQPTRLDGVVGQWENTGKGCARVVYDFFIGQQIDAAITFAHSATPTCITSFTDRKKTYANAIAHGHYLCGI